MYPCPCCGYLTLTGPPGSYEICDVCWWEDDAVQLRYPELKGGANLPSLVEAQATFQARGSSDMQHSSRTRPPGVSDALDSGWRMLDTSRDDYEKAFSATPMPDDSTARYWWRQTYWRR